MPLTPANPERATRELDIRYVVLGGNEPGVFRHPARPIIPGGRKTAFPIAIMCRSQREGQQYHRLQPLIASFQHRDTDTIIRNLDRMAAHESVAATMTTPGKFYPTVSDKDGNAMIYLEWADAYNYLVGASYISYCKKEMFIDALKFMLRHPSTSEPPEEPPLSEDHLKSFQAGIDLEDNSEGLANARNEDHHGSRAQTRAAPFTNMFQQGARSSADAATASRAPSPSKRAVSPTKRMPSPTKRAASPTKRAASPAKRVASESSPTKDTSHTASSPQTTDHAASEIEGEQRARQTTPCFQNIAVFAPRLSPAEFSSADHAPPQPASPAPSAMPPPGLASMTLLGDAIGTRPSTFLPPGTTFINLRRDTGEVYHSIEVPAFGMSAVPSLGRVLDMWADSFGYSNDYIAFLADARLRSISFNDFAVRIARVNTYSEAHWFWQMMDGNAAASTRTLRSRLCPE